MTSKNKCNKDNRKDSDSESESSIDSEYNKKRKQTHRKKNNKCDNNTETCESEKINNYKSEKEEEIFIKFEIKTTLKKGLNIIKIKFEKV